MTSARFQLCASGEVDSRRGKRQTNADDVLDQVGVVPSAETPEDEANRVQQAAEDKETGQSPRFVVTA